MLRIVAELIIAIVGFGLLWRLIFGWFVPNFTRTIAKMGAPAHVVASPTPTRR
jgi:hypothetical protein